MCHHCDGRERSRKYCHRSGRTYKNGVCDGTPGRVEVERALTASRAKEKEDRASADAAEMAELTKEKWNGATLQAKKNAKQSFRMRFLKAMRAAHPLSPTDYSTTLETPSQSDAQFKRLVQAPKARSEYEDEQLQSAYQRFLTGKLTLSDSNAKWFAAAPSRGANTMAG